MSLAAYSYGMAMPCCRRARAPNRLRLIATPSVRESIQLF